MSQIIARVPNAVVEALDAVAEKSNRSRADIIRQALEHYLEDYDDLEIALDRLQDQSDPVLEWPPTKNDLLSSD